MWSVHVEVGGCFISAARLNETVRDCHPRAHTAAFKLSVRCSDSSAFALLYRTEIIKKLN
jgi:hypothetical protein